MFVEFGWLGEVTARAKESEHGVDKSLEHRIADAFDKVGDCLRSFFTGLGGVE